jgi:hypothetical protein
LEPSGRSTTISIGGQLFTLNQAGVACTYSINPPASNPGSGASSGQFTVLTQAGCTWTAVSAAAWVTVTAPPNGAGNGQGDVTYSVQPNPDPAPRTTTITAGGQSHTINQAAAPAPCTYSLNPPTASLTSAGGAGTFTITTQANCAWTASTLDSWIMVTGNASGTGTADVSYSVQPNGTGAARSGAISAAGQTFAISEAP